MRVVMVIRTFGSTRSRLNDPSGEMERSNDID